MSPTELFLANRRDGLLLLLLQGLTLAWSWEQGTWAALVGSLVTAGLFALLLTLFRQSNHAIAALLPPRSENGVPLGGRPFAATQWGLILLMIGGLPTTLLVARAAWQGLGSQPLMMLLALLTLGWQVWLSIWTAELPPPPPEEE